ncbi:ATP-sensitive inward rectifier potassium channel 12-like protein [Sarcoptes scabiei]|nr:ATP-sensitive inward rectifier potassium channel 12-like protein [Sarcoptes scabiei]
MNADDLCREKFEIVAFLEGTVESTGQTVQARTSYLPSEILWGYRFEQIIRYQHNIGEYLVDYSRFNNVYMVDTSYCSAEELDEELYQQQFTQESKN